MSGQSFNQKEIDYMQGEIREGRAPDGAIAIEQIKMLSDLEIIISDSAEIEAIKLWAISALSKITGLSEKRLSDGSIVVFHPRIHFDGPATISFKPNFTPNNELVTRIREFHHKQK